MEFQKGDKVHVDSDTEEWGRVCSKATVVETPSKSSKLVLLSVETVQACLLVPKENCDLRL